MDVPDLVLAFGLVATVLTGTALASGLVERSPLSFPLIFLALGLVLFEAEGPVSWRWMQGTPPWRPSQL